MILADKITELRKLSGWSQEELADKLGVSRQSVSKWEMAQSTPDMNRIVMMAKLFGVSTDYLLLDEVRKPEQWSRMKMLFRTIGLPGRAYPWRRQISSLICVHARLFR